MIEKAIQLGSIVIEKAENKPLRVLDVAHETAGEHDYIDVDDPENRQWGVEPDDPVYECGYLTTSGADDSTRPPTRTYAFPEGRLYRYRCEAALPEDARRIHTQIIEAALAEVLVAADDEGPAVRENVEAAISRSGIDTEVSPEVLLQEAAEIAKASQIGGGDS